VALELFALFPLRTFSSHKYQGSGLSKAVLCIDDVYEYRAHSVCVQQEHDTCELLNS